MRIYFKMENKLGEFELDELYCMDCMEGLKKIPENSIDLIVTSPGYCKVSQKRLSQESLISYKNRQQSQDITQEKLQ